MQKVLTFFFSKSISVYVIFDDHSFNDTLTNGIIRFEQLGPGQKNRKEPRSDRPQGWTKNEKH